MGTYSIRIPKGVETEIELVYTGKISNAKRSLPPKGLDLLELPQKS